MKNKLLIIGLVLSGIFVGCQTEYEAPNSLSDIGFYNSAGTVKTLNVALNKYMSFTDLSQGAIDHKWTIEQGVNFLQGPIKTKDTIFKVIKKGDTITKDLTVILQFTKPGISKVRLYNVFKDSVTFRGNTNNINYLKGSVKIAPNRWVIDTTFMVKVYDTLAPKFVIKQNDVALDLSSKDTVYVEAGDKLHFSDLTTQGEPTARTWSIRKVLAAGVAASPSDVVGSAGTAEADIIFKKLGIFRASLSVTRSGLNIPSAFKTVIINRPIKVVPSSKPFVLSGTIREQQNETIQIPFAGEFAAFTDVKSKFTVKVNGITFSIASVTMNALDQTILDLKLTDKIYRPDVITISYNGTVLKSTDNRVLQSFTDVPVAMHDVNLLGTAALAGFEDGGGVWKKYFSSDAPGLINSEKPFAGNFSAKLSLVTGQKESSISTLPAGGTNFPSIVNQTGKVYVVTWKMFITPESNTVGKAMGLFYIPAYSQVFVNLADKPKGEWFTVTGEIPVGTLTGLYLRLIDGTKLTNVTLYIDDLKIVEKEVRP
ncbi:hypothetical protein FFWV33_12255 [Flavobacterium faecale]|uniref:Uncharacterized protein n=1 Tax=Flavobacterium faecale TaxID=1355330 RepID=A0A2S1LER0_9FLAO|nr:hypothetical protein [Flavobacterium faecale]AWG22233.1 hypothetical protein FFWV33_12255 [Flavobacterium faecale]